MVGHNPTMASMAQLLDDGEGDAEAGAELATAASRPARVAVFEHDGAWADLGVGLRPAASAFHVRPAAARVPAAQSGGAGVTMPASASAASISSREMPSRYMIASRYGTLTDVSAASRTTCLAL